MSNNLDNLTPGDRLLFKPGYRRQQYGITATFQEVTESISRPYGTRTKWYSFVTENGTKLVWEASTVRQSFLLNRF